MPRVESRAPAAAAIGVALAWLAPAADPLLCVLTLGALGAWSATRRGDDRPQAVLATRLLAALVYLAAGVRHPSPFGLPLIGLGVGLAGLALFDARRAARARRLLTPLALTVQSPDGSRSSCIEVPAGASGRYAARRAAAALSIHGPSQRRLSRDGALLDPDRSLISSGVRAGDSFALVAVDSAAVVASPTSEDRYMNVPSYGERWLRRQRRERVTKAR